MRQQGRKTRFRGVNTLGNGRYRVRVYFTDPLTGRHRERDRIINARSVEEAFEKKQALSRALETNGGRCSSERRTVGETAIDWLEQATARVRSDGTSTLAPLTQERYRRSVRDFIVPFFERMDARELHARDIEAWRDHLVASGYRASTVNGHLRVLRLVLQEVGNPAARTVRAVAEDDTRTTDDDPNLLSEDELTRFLEVARRDWPQHYAMIVLMFSTAMRMGTVRALRWEDLDLEQGIIRVRRRISGSEILQGVKRSRRSADFPPLWPEVIDALEVHRESFNEAQLASGLLFPTKTGGVRARSALDKPYQAILERAGIEKRLTPSTGPRRTAARMYRKVADSAVAKAVAGHLTDKMHRHYGQVDIEEKQEAASRLRQRLGLLAPSADTERGANRVNETGDSTGDQTHKPGTLGR